jgi:hypothetical protein
MRDAVGFRWSGPGRFSVLRVAAPPGPGRAEAHLLLLPGEAIPDVAIFLNGHRLALAQRRLGAFGVIEAAWDASVTEGDPRHEFWFVAERTIQLPAPGERMRAVGFRLSTLTIEPAAQGPRAPADAAALIAGRRFLADRLPVAAGRPWISFRREAEAALLDIRLEGARLGPPPQPHLALALRATAGGIELALGAPEVGTITARHAAGEPLALGTPLAARDEMLALRLLGELPGAFGRWLDQAMEGAAPDAALLADWRMRLGAVARAADARLAALLADGPDPFGGDPAAPFGWPVLSS